LIPIVTLKPLGMNQIDSTSPGWGSARLELANFIYFICFC